MIFRYLERRRIRWLFGKYVSPEVIAEIIESGVSKTEGEAFRNFVAGLNPFRSIPPSAYAEVARKAEEAIRSAEAATRKESQQASRMREL